MIFPFTCSQCEKDKWLIRYHSDGNFHKIECINCGTHQILEEIFGKRRKRTNVKKQIYKRDTKKDRSNKESDEELKQISEDEPPEATLDE